MEEARSFAAAARLGGNDAAALVLRRGDAKPGRCLAPPGAGRRSAGRARAEPGGAASLRRRRRAPRSARSGAATAAAPSFAPAPKPAGPVLRAFTDVVALAREKRDIRLVQALEQDVRVAKFEPLRIEIAIRDGAASSVAQALSKQLAEWTGERWIVSVVAQAAAPTLREVADAAEAQRNEALAAHPLVSAILKRFPGASIVAERGAAPEPPPPEEAPARRRHAGLPAARGRRLLDGATQGQGESPKRGA